MGEEDENRNMEVRRAWNSARAATAMDKQVT